MITLVKDTIDNKDIDRLVDWLKTYPRLTKGPVTLELEKKFSDWLGTEYSVFCNSGSSANLLMLSVLKEKYDAKKVVVPSVAWSTTISPIIQFGLEHIMVDADKKTFGIDLIQTEELLKNFKFVTLEEGIKKVYDNFSKRYNR